ncbi:MAG: hypothetical protein ABIK28_01280, partial [Planctomycetota bacterium]
QVLSGHSWALNTATFDPDGKKIVTASEDTTARIWDVETGVVIAKLSGHQDVVRSATFDATGSKVLTASDDGTALVWSINPQGSFEACYPILHSGPVVAASFIPDGSKILTACEDGIVRKWDIASFDLLASFQRSDMAAAESHYPNRIFWENVNINPETLFRGHEGSINALSIRYDGGQVVTASSDFTIRCWDITPNPDAKCLSYRTPDKPIKIAFNPVGTKMVWVHPDHKRFYMVDLINGVTTCFSGDYAGWLKKVDFNTSGKKCRKEWKDGQLRLFDLSANPYYPAVYEEKKYSIRNIQFTPTGRLLLNLERNIIQIWNLETSKVENAFEYRGDLYSLAVSPDENRILVAAGDYGVHDYNLKENKDAYRIFPDENFYSLSFSADCQRILTRSESGKVELWDGDSFERIACFPVIAEQACFSHFDQTCMTVTMEGTIQLWDGEVGALISTLKEKMGKGVRAVWCPTGGKIVAWDLMGSIWIWDIDKKENPLSFYKQVKPIKRAVFSADGKWICLVTSDNDVNLFDLNSGELAISHAFESPVSSVAFVEDDRVAVATKEGMTKVFPLNPLAISDKVKPRDLTQEGKDLFEVGIAGNDPVVANETRPDSLTKENTENVRDTNGQTEKDIKSCLVLQDFPETLSQNQLEPFCFVAKNDQVQALMIFDPRKNDGDIRTVQNFDTTFKGTYALCASKSKVCLCIKNDEDHIDIKIKDLIENPSVEAHLVCRTDRSKVTNPTWHPDGTKIYFSMAEQNSETTAWDIYWVNVEGPPDQKPILLVG